MTVSAAEVPPVVGPLEDESVAPFQVTEVDPVAATFGNVIPDRVSSRLVSSARRMAISISRRSRTHSAPDRCRSVVRGSYRGRRYHP
ncbi:hypothetical protein ACFQL0_11505 [Haloplanus litoreus]|uniref:hypothetical protein n=1 Tax=Haloplanus litoreus TaxID=767515 RepID=UPI0036060EC7